MENNMIHTDKDASAALKQKALPYLPRNLGDVTAQKQILAMIARVVPAVASFSAEADVTIWADAANARMPMNQAIAQCAYQADRMIGSSAAYSTNLSSIPEEELLQAWIALDYYSYVLKGEYSRNLRLMQQQITDILLIGKADRKQEKAAAPYKPVSETVFVSETAELLKAEETEKKREKAKKKEKAPKQKKAPRNTNAGTKGGKAKVVTAAVLAMLILVISVSAAFLLSDTRKAKLSIERIGTVTLESEEKILKAEELYAALSESDQEKITNRDVLFSARAEYDSLVAEDAIDAIGKVTLESNAAITHAEEVYEGLSRDAKNLVDNYKTLTAARKEYDRLDEAVRNASAAIDAIGQVTLDSGKKIEEARAAYDALEKDNLKPYLADKLPTLENAEKEYRNLASQDLYDTGIAHSESQRYEEAIACFDTIIADYSDTDLLESARESRAQCQIALAEQAHGKRDYYTAMNALKAVEEPYRTLDSYRQAEEKIIRALNTTRPSNNAAIDGYLSWGQCYFSITAPDQDICLKVQNTWDSSKYKLVYIRAGQTAKLNVEDGSYTVKWVTGQYWYGKEHLFGDDAVYKSLGNITFTTTRSGNWIHYQYLELDLADTSISSSTIKPEAF